MAPACSGRRGRLRPGVRRPSRRAMAYLDSSATSTATGCRCTSTTKAPARRGRPGRRIARRGPADTELYMCGPIGLMDAVTPVWAEHAPAGGQPAVRDLRQQRLVRPRGVPGPPPQSTARSWLDRHLDPGRPDECRDRRAVGPPEGRVRLAWPRSSRWTAPSLTIADGILSEAHKQRSRTCAAVPARSPKKPVIGATVILILT